MKNVSIKNMVKEIASRAVYVEKYGYWVSNFEGRTYQFMCSPQEFIAAKSNTRMPAIDTWARRTEATVKRRQDALLWLWQNLKQWHHLEAAYIKIAGKVQEAKQISAQLACYTNGLTWDERNKLRERESKIAKQLADYNKKHTFLDGYSVEYLYNTMPHNWKHLAAA